MSKNPLYVLVGDTHSGGLTALALPRFTIKTGQVVVASPLQRDLYDFWCDFWGQVDKRRRGRPLHVYFMGDAVDGRIKETTQSLPSKVDQEELAYQLLTPVRKKATRLYMLKGTDAHVGRQAASEERLADRLRADGLAYHILVEHKPNQILFDLAHHGKVGGRPWTSSAAAVAAMVELEFVKHKLPIPRFVVRAHSHVIDDSGARNRLVRAFTTPAWQCRNSHSHKVASFAISDLGGVIVDGEQVDFIRYSFDSVGRYEDTLLVKI